MFMVQGRNFLKILIAKKAKTPPSVAPGVRPTHFSSLSFPWTRVLLTKKFSYFYNMVLISHLSSYRGGQSVIFFYIVILDGCIFIQCLIYPQCKNHKNWKNQDLSGNSFGLRNLP